MIEKQSDALIIWKEFLEAELPIPRHNTLNTKIQLPNIDLINDLLEKYLRPYANQSNNQYSVSKLLKTYKAKHQDSIGSSSTVTSVNSNNFNNKSNNPGLNALADMYFEDYTSI